MFDRFYRADPSRSSAAGGVGLGLSISKELATAHRGRLWAEIGPDGQLHVQLSIPAVPGPQRTLSTQRLPAMPGLAAPERIRG
jgi:signal transduction histidine kinase